jgi:uncharacterized protein (DUF2249 family)
MNTQDTEVTLDVRAMFARGESPCGTIDAAVASLAPGQALVLLVPFEPIPLYTKLGKQGFAHATTQEPDGTWRVKFTRGSAPSHAPTEPVPCACRLG